MKIKRLFIWTVCKSFGFLSQLSSLSSDTNSVRHAATNRSSRSNAYLRNFSILLKLFIEPISWEQASSCCSSAWTTACARRLRHSFNVAWPQKTRSRCAVAQFAVIRVCLCCCRRRRHCSFLLDFRTIVTDWAFRAKIMLVLW